MVRTVTKIFSFRVNNVSSNGSINFGPTINKGFSANTKQVGGQSVIGDFGVGKNIQKNVVLNADQS